MSTTETSPAQPLKVITCLDPTGEREQCGALVENTLEARRIHRKWHAQDKTVKARDSEVRNLKLQLADMQRDVENIDIPEPASPVEIDSGGWSDDDEPDDDEVTVASATPDYEDQDTGRADAEAAFTPAPPTSFGGPTTEPEPRFGGTFNG